MPCTECDGFGGSHEEHCPQVAGRFATRTSDGQVTLLTDLVYQEGDEWSPEQKARIAARAATIERQLEQTQRARRCPECLAPVGWDPPAPHAEGCSFERAYVAVDPDTLMSGDNYSKLLRVISLIAGGLGYEGIHKWLAMWPDIDTAVREAEKSASGGFQ